MNQLKVFTVKEANDSLPQLNPLLQELRQKRDAILNLEVEIDALELVTEKRKGSSSSALNSKVEEYTQTVNRFYAVMDAIHEVGCVVKDVDIGLVDFYSLYKGKVVYLCWKSGEPEVGHWHEIGAGYGQRQPIERQHSEH